ncbi:porin family protein [Lutibacter holmesii]|uniref:Porin family protein n=1 Tax=Lutibacter holmesii TaxID=1137985 RepID=A0ABW3WQN5_9FLAO
MKKIILSVSILLLAITSINAQASFGIKGGVNFASILNENINGVKGRTSFNVGLVAEVETSYSTAVQVELLYSGQGFKYNGGGIIGGVEALEDTYRLDYLNLPVVFKYYFKEGFSFESGPQLGILLSAKAVDADVKVGDAFTDLTFDWLIGFGYKFDNGFNVNARYTLGLTDIWKGPTVNPPYYYYNYGKVNGVFQLTLGYYFN